jgi:flagellar hook-associated protein 2
MATISGGSMIDVNTLVSQLVAAERAPTDNRFNKIQTTTQAQISAFGQISSALSGLDSSLKRFDGEGALPGRKTTVAAEAGYTARASSQARLGNYAISVERLATAHKLQSAPLAAATQLGNGRITIQAGTGTPVNIDIPAGGGTLAQIGDAINRAMADKGVSATVVHGDDGDVLTLAATTTGTAGKLTVTTSGGDGGLAALASSGGGMTEVSQALDAKVMIDGVSRTSSSNTLADALDGVSLTLTKAAPGTTFKLDVNNDSSTLKAQLLTFVSSYNTALTQMRTQSAAGANGKASGTLVGDSAPRSIMQSLRGTMASSYGELSKLGFKTAVDGSLSLDGAKFDTAIANDPSAIDRLLGTDGALGKSLRGAMKSYIGSGSMLDSRTESLNKKLKDLGRQRDNYEVHIERVTAQYRAQFSALDAMVTRLQGTSNYLSQQLASLSSSSS